ncbi:unnamed protein product, partial [Aphanomyces euteiches]
MDEIAAHPQAVEHTTTLSKKLHFATQGIVDSHIQANQAVNQVRDAAGAIKALEEQVLELREEKLRMQDQIEAASAANLALKLEAEAARILAAASKEANLGSTSSRGDSKGKRAFIKGDPTPLIQAFLAGGAVSSERFESFAVIGSTPLQPRIFEPSPLFVNDAGADMAFSNHQPPDRQPKIIDLALELEEMDDSGSIDGKKRPTEIVRLDVPISKKMRRFSGTGHIQAKKDISWAPSELVELYSSIVAKKPWERFKGLPSFLPDEFKGELLWQRFFYFPGFFDSKNRTLDNMVYQLGSLMLVLKRLNEDPQFGGKLVEFLCHPQPGFPIVLPETVDLQDIFETHGLEVTMNYLKEEHDSWWPRVPDIMEGKILRPWTLPFGSLFRYDASRNGRYKQANMEAEHEIKDFALKSMDVVNSAPAVSDILPFIQLKFSGVEIPQEYYGGQKYELRTKYTIVDLGEIQE